MSPFLLQIYLFALLSFYNCYFTDIFVLTADLAYSPQTPARTGLSRQTEFFFFIFRRHYIESDLTFSRKDNPSESLLATPTVASSLPSLLGFLTRCYHSRKSFDFQRFLILTNHRKGINLLEYCVIRLKLSMFAWYNR